MYRYASMSRFINEAVGAAKYSAGTKHPDLREMLNFFEWSCREFSGNSPQAAVTRMTVFRNYS